MQASNFPFILMNQSLKKNNEILLNYKMQIFKVTFSD